MFDMSTPQPPTAFPPPPRTRPGRKPAQRSTPRRRSLSRDAIIDAALAIVDAEGIDAVTMRRVGEALGTGGASLYAHITDKDELLDACFDRVLGRIELVDRIDARRWQAQLKDMIRSWRKELLKHRDLARVSMGRVPVGPNALRGLENLLAILRAGKLSDHVVVYAVDQIAAFVMASAYEASLWERNRTLADQEWEQQMADFLTQLPADEFPSIRALAGPLLGSGDDGDDRFEFGLDVIVRGIAAQGRR